MKAKTFPTRQDKGPPKTRRRPRVSRRRFQEADLRNRLRPKYRPSGTMSVCPEIGRLLEQFWQFGSRGQSRSPEGGSPCKIKLVTDQSDQGPVHRVLGTHKGIQLDLAPIKDISHPMCNMSDVERSDHPYSRTH
jgi:hypothetical protein